MHHRILDAIARQRKRVSRLASTLWAFATVGHTSPALLERNAVATKVCVEGWQFLRTYKHDV
eukprot:52802-Karenia_brevis.AAC.1